MNYINEPFGRAEDLDCAYVVATYEAEMPDLENAMKRAGAFAVGQTVGTWITVPGLSERMMQEYQGVVLAVYYTGQSLSGLYQFLLKVAFPSANFGSSMTQMMTALAGNDVSTSLKGKLIDIEFANGAQIGFSAPKQGIKELREMTGVQDRPLVLNMIKPCAGYTSKEGLDMFLEVARGGMDLVKDDELLGSPSYNSVVERTALYVRAAEALYGETGKYTVYIPNISGRPGQMRDNIRRVLDAGAKTCMINFVFGGLDTLLELNEEFGKDIFILAHYSGISVMESGVSNGVYLGLLARLAGAHAVMTMCPNPSNPLAMQDFYRTVQMQRLRIPNLPSVVTAVGGGITPVNHEWIQKDLGNDTIIGIGGAVQGHPLGATVGAQTAIYAVCASSQGMSISEAASDHKGLRAILDLWSA